MKTYRVLYTWGGGKVEDTVRADGFDIGDKGTLVYFRDDRGGTIATYSVHNLISIRETR